MHCKNLGKHLRKLLPLVCMAALLPACAAQETSDASQAGMEVAVTLRDVHRCSRISPEILVTSAPRGTEYYDVRLLEHLGDGQELFLGGGTWNEDGTGAIPEGGLTRHYRGPCPPAGFARNYTFVVSAMRRKDAQPLAVRIYQFTQE